MLLLGIDNGSTVCKAALYSEDGREVGTASRRIPLLQRQPGWFERDLSAVWAATAATIRELIDSVGIDSAEIVALGCTGHGNGVYLLDAHGSPLGYSVQSTDTRAMALLAEWAGRGALAASARRTLQQAYAGQPAPLLAWYRQHEPDVYARVAHVLLCKDYVNYCLTGAIASDFSDLSSANLLDVVAKRFDPALLDVYGLDDLAGKIPTPLASTALMGQVTADAAAQTGLAAGTPVIAGMIDIAASAIGTGAIQPGQACIIAGTWSINQVITCDVNATSDLFLTAIFADPSLYLAVEGSPTSAVNLDWFIHEFCAAEVLQAEREGVSVYEVCNRLVEQTPIDASRIIFHPFLFGSNADAGVNARAGFYGVMGWHTRAHLLRALYEGIAFGHLSHVERLRAAGITIDVARFTGGAANSPVWAQMFADVLALPLEVVTGGETGTRGAALAAGVGVELYADLAAAVRRAINIRQTYTPDAERTAVYRKRYAVYQHLIEVMRTVWGELEK